MKTRLLPLATVILAVAVLFLPLVNLEVHSQIAPEIAAQFPGSISLMDVLLHGADALPTAAVPGLKLIHFEQWMLLSGLILMGLSGVAALIRKRGTLLLSAALSLCAAGLLGVFGVQCSNVCGSLLFTLLMDLQAWVWAPMVIAVVQLALVVFLVFKEKDGIDLTDRTWRILGGVLAVLAVLVMLLPAHVISVPDTVTADPADAAAMNRSLSLLDEALGKEVNLKDVAAEQGVFANVLTGSLAELEPYSADGNNIKGVFVITTETTAPNVMLLAAAVLLVLALALSLIPKVDRWFPLVCEAVALVLVVMSVLGVMTISQNDMFTSATRQLSKLGVGAITPIPMGMALLALAAFLCGVMSVRTANVPYFINPIPEKQRLRVVAISLVIVKIGRASCRERV